MSTLDSTLDAPVDRTVADPDATAAAPSVVGVLATSDHKVIGRLLIGTSLLGLLVVATLGGLLGIERIDGDGTVLADNALAQLFAGYRLGLIEAAVLPLLLGVSVLAVPLQLGARSLAFPRAAAAGFWGWLGGIVLVAVALINNGGPAGGQERMVGLYLAGNVLTLVGLLLVAATVATSVLTTRAPGMRMTRVPLFSWGALVSSLGLVLVLPVAIGVHIYLYVDYQYTREAFGAASGILDWTSYLLTGPVLPLFALPAVGFAAELVPVVLRKRLPMRFVASTGLALVGVAALAGVTQQDVINLPWPGDGLWDTDARSSAEVRSMFADIVTFAVLVLLPLLGMLLVLAVGPLAAKPERRRAKVAKPNLIAPFGLGFVGVGLVVLGAAASALNSIDDLGLQGTVFEEGATVAVVYGAIAGGLGAVAYWIPKLTGRTLPTAVVAGLAPLALAAAALASIPYFVAGFADQPGFAAEYANDGPGELLNVLVTAGHVLMALVGLAFAALAIPALLGLSRTSAAADAGDNPWLAHTLEWDAPSPVPAYNYAETPTVMSPEPVLDRRAAPDFADRKAGLADQEAVGGR